MLSDTIGSRIGGDLVMAGRNFANTQARVGKQVDKLDPTLRDECMRIQPGDLTTHLQREEEDNRRRQGIVPVDEVRQSDLDYRTRLAGCASREIGH